MDKVQKHSSFNTLINLRFPLKAANPLTTWATISFSSCTLLRGVSSLRLWYVVYHHGMKMKHTWILFSEIFMQELKKTTKY